MLSAFVHPIAWFYSIDPGNGPAPRDGVAGLKVAVLMPYLSNDK
jgi:hypothetical protein